MRWMVVTAMIGWLGTGPVGAEPSLANMILAVVNDAVITQGEVLLNARRALESIDRLYKNRPDKLEREAVAVMQESLTNLVAQHLILNDYKTSGLQFPEALIEDEIKRRIRERYGDRANLTKDLQGQGMTYEDYRQRLREDFITMAMLQRNEGTAVLVSPAKIERYYRDHITNYAVGDQLNMRTLMRSAAGLDDSGETRRLMLELARKLAQGAPFAEMTAIYSEGASGQGGGDWGWQALTFWAKGIADVAVRLEPKHHGPLIGILRDGDDAYAVHLYSDSGKPHTVRHYRRNPDTGKEEMIRETAVSPQEALALAEPDDYYLIYVEDKRPARTRPLAEVQDDIEKELLRRETQRLRDKWIERLRGKAFVRYF
ncbi:MAG: SurA N-terminal domain-containing protein [Verrucomicrobia bacterium]|nr:SurA N-terminal domain-containing protein [Verrucomicrobiota bacterium]